MAVEGEIAGSTTMARISSENEKSDIVVQSQELDSEVDDEKAPLLSQLDDSPTASRPSSPDPSEDSLFDQPTPSPFKRLALLLFIFFLFWAGFKMRSGLLEAKRKPTIIHASRYSKEFKFRPAASPIITETLKDGRIRLRGALPEPTATTTPPVVKRKKKTSNGKVSGKGKSSKAKAKAKTGSGTGKRM